MGINNHPHTIHGTGTFTYIWLILMVNVGKYTSPMDGMGSIYWPSIKPGYFWWQWLFPLWGGVTFSDSAGSFKNNRMHSYVARMSEELSNLFLLSQWLTFWTFGDSIFNRENKVQTFLFRVHWLSECWKLSDFAYLSIGIYWGYHPCSMY